MVVGMAWCGGGGGGASGNAGCTAAGEWAAPAPVRLVPLDGAQRKESEERGVLLMGSSDGALTALTRARPSITSRLSFQDQDQDRSGAADHTLRLDESRPDAPGAVQCR